MPFQIHEIPWSLLLFARLEHPVIREQVLDMLEVANRGRVSRKALEERFLANLEMVKNWTPVSFETRRSHTSGHDKNSREVISLGYVDPRTGRKYSSKERHITEAHEKGHVIRWDYQNGRDRLGPELSTVFRYNLAPSFYPAFDFSGAVRACDRNYLRDPAELAERMSQLKNYFGFCGAETFSPEHLRYAGEHYLEDTGYDNGMSPFFRIITPERESAFIELINSAGI